MAGERDVLSAEAREALRDAVIDGWHGMDDSWIDYQAVLAALAARGWRLVPSALPREALDVERLARALARYNDFAEDDHADIWTLLGEPGREAWRAKAAAIAREYAALSPDRPTPP